MSSHADLMHELNRLFCFISTISQLSFFTFADESVSHHASYVPYDLTFLCASDPWSDRRLLFYVPGLLALASKRTIVVLYALYAPQLGIPTGRRSGRNVPRLISSALHTWYSNLNWNLLRSTIASRWFNFSSCARRLIIIRCGVKQVQNKESP